MIRFQLKLSLILLLLTGLTTICFSQRQTGSIEGQVIDTEGEPLPGVSVTLSGPALMGTLTYTTRFKGDFRFPLVPPGSDYVIMVKIPGFQKYKQEQIIVSLGKTLSLTIHLSQEIVKEEILVTPRLPLVDVKSSKISMNYTEDIIENLPVERSHIDIILTAPGIVEDETMPTFRPFVSHGSTARGNMITLDGINITDPYYQTNSFDLSYDIFEEYEIELGSHPAEVGMTDGAYINIVTKSGGNELHGQINTQFYNRHMVAT